MALDELDHRAGPGRDVQRSAVIDPRHRPAGDSQRVAGPGELLEPRGRDALPCPHRRGAHRDCQDVDADPVVDESGDRAATAQGFVVGMGSHHQYLLSGPQTEDAHGVPPAPGITRPVPVVLGGVAGRWPTAARNVSATACG